METGIERARNVLYDIGQGIDLSARNHWLADQSAVPGATPEPPWSTASPGPFIPVEAHPFPLCGNITGPIPTVLAGKVPMGDPEKLRAGANAFRTARKTLDAITAALHQALYSMFAYNDSEDLRALDEFWHRVGGPSDRTILTALRDACANWIVDTTNEINHALETVLKEMALGALLALLLAALTEGIGALFGAAEAGADAGLLIAAIDGVITATNVTTRATAVGAAAGGVIGLLQVTIDTTPSPNLNPTDPQVTTDAQITTQSGNLADRTNTTTPEHYQELGYDPASKQFRSAEADTGVRIENERGVHLTRSLQRDSGPDWIGSDGKTYDAVGNFDSRYFDRQWPTLQNRILDHLRKADFVPVDVSKFTGEQVSRIKEFIAALEPRVFLVGE